MTKEEAITYIIPAIKKYWNDKICDDIIKALKQESCTDCISRQMDNRMARKYEAALTILYGMRAENLNLDDAYTKDKFDALTMAINAVKNEVLECEGKNEN